MSCGLPRAVNASVGIGRPPGSRRAAAPQPRCHRRCAGFTYLAVLFLLALAGITATATGIVWRIEHQREQEVELRFAGVEFARAIESYRAVAPNAAQPWPRSLDDLLRDPRTPGVRRHLRKIYRDPVHRSAEWGLIRTQDGGIVGVHSLSLRRPIRRLPSTGMTVREPDRYAGWLFVAAGAPPIVRDSRSGMWMAAGPTAPIPAAPGQPAPAPASSPVPDGGGATAASPAAVSTVTPAATTKPATQPPRPRPGCSVVARNDQTTCAAVAQRFGSTDGDACMASAAAREAQCSAGQEVTTSLAVRYF